MAEPDQTNPDVVSMAEFLETVPPNVGRTISDLAGRETQWEIYHLNLPDLRLHCSSDVCGGTRTFQALGGEEEAPPGRHVFCFARYVCRNCRMYPKTFALHVTHKGDGSGTALKLGETPLFGPPVPARVISLVGPDRPLFLKGRASENHGLGIGAFAYYRRVVENQKGRIVGEIAKVAQRLDARQDALKRFHEAAAERSFAKAVEKIEGAIPQDLLINGHNPLTPLYRALSEGLHSRSDEECLELAAEIRLVLTELAERISQALKEDAELKAAVDRLLNRPAAKNDGESQQ